MIPFWRALVARAGYVAAGVAVAVVALQLLLPSVGLGELERIRQLGVHLGRVAETGENEGAICVVGNSVVVEGLDAEAASRAAGGVPVRNYGVNGLRLDELLLVLPKVLRTRPAHVAVSVLPVNLLSAEPTDQDVAHALAMGGFVEALGDDRDRLLGRHPTSVRSALNSSTVEQLTFFRNAPVLGVDKFLRFRLSAGKRSGTDSDWADPHMLTRNVSDEVWSGVAGRLVRECDGAAAAAVSRNLETLELIAEQCRSASVTCTFVLPPVAPELHEAVAAVLPRVDRIASERGVRVVSTLDLLTRDQFADPLHPNSDGRAVLSARIGEELLPRFADGEGPVVR